MAACEESEEKVRKPPNSPLLLMSVLCHFLISLKIYSMARRNIKNKTFNVSKQLLQTDEILH